MNNSYNIIKFDSNYDDLVNSGVISPLNRYKYSFYINSDKLFFKEDTDRMYYELIGSAIGDYLNILHTSYKLTMIETSDTNIKGVTSKDYREDGYKLIKFNNILFGKEMTLDNISERLNIYFNDYRNKDIIVKLSGEFFQAAVIVLVLYYIIFPVKITGESMYSALENNDRVLMSRAAAMLNLYDTGDIVVLNYNDGIKNIKIDDNINIIIKDGEINAKVMEVKNER